jgi:hypothetical protein
MSSVISDQVKEFLSGQRAYVVTIPLTDFRMVLPESLAFSASEAVDAWAEMDPSRKTAKQRQERWDAAKCQVERVRLDFVCRDNPDVEEPYTFQLVDTIEEHDLLAEEQSTDASK